MTPLYVQPRALEIYINGDGQRFTDLIRSWASVFLRRCGASDFSVNGVSWRPDGGVDGLVNDPQLVDPFGWFVPKSVFQFKAGDTTVSKAREELLQEPKPAETRIRDKIVDGYKVVWFVGRTLVDLDRETFEDGLATAVSSVNASAPTPLVIDLNRLAQLMSLTPAVALQVTGNSGLFMTSDAALMETPHSHLPTFVPGSHYPDLQADVQNFFLSDHSEPIKYIAGEPGTGKSRSILEVVESSRDLCGKVAYFPDATMLSTFLSLAKQEQWRGFAIIDEFTSSTKLNRDNAPSGFRFLLIGHAYETSRDSQLVTNCFVPLTEEETISALSAKYSGLLPFQISEAVRMSRQNIRLARLICEHYSRNPRSLGIDAPTLGRIVAEELSRMQGSRAHDAIKRLALLPSLLGDDVIEFCELVTLDKDSFRSTCRQISQSSGLVQFSDHVVYIGSPAVAQISLIRLWNEDPELARRVLGNPGKFADQILVSINRLPACLAREEMLRFFELPVAGLTLPDLLARETGRRFLTLLTAQPDVYLPVLHRLVMAEQGNLTGIPYEGADIGRREIIWPVRDLAQFEEYFQLCEEIVYAFAREETPSAYSNTATSYWIDWFRAYFDYTVFPYDIRLDILEKRVKDGDELDHGLVIKAVSNPFPEVGGLVPSSRVGGRVAPPELRFIRREQVEIAASRIPELIAMLLEIASAGVVDQVVDMVVESRIQWLERGMLGPYVEVLQTKGFPESGRHRIIADTRHYVGLSDGPDGGQDWRVRRLREQHAKLLALIDVDDPIIDLLEVANHEIWRGMEKGTPEYRKLEHVMTHCLSKADTFDKALEILGDPTKAGGATFGRLIGPSLNSEQLGAVMSRVRNVGLSSFTYAALAAASSESTSRQEVLQRFASELESERPSTSLAIYQLLGDEVYLQEFARMLASSEVSVLLFRGFVLRSPDELPRSVWELVDVLQKRFKSGDTDALRVLAAVVGELAYARIEDERAFNAGMLVLQETPCNQQLNALVDWSAAAIWLHERFPADVILLAASREQSEFSQATRALAEFANSEPLSVLDALIQKLSRPNESPFLFHGALLSIVESIPENVFRDWLIAQGPPVLETVAGHLPKPKLLDGNAVVPVRTRAFWEVCPSVLGDRCQQAMREFRAHTFSTGVYWGNGIDLFETRLEIARQLRNDPNAMIREWAEGFYRETEHMLQDAIRREQLDEAERATDD